MGEGLFHCTGLFNGTVGWRADGAKGSATGTGFPEGTVGWPDIGAMERWGDARGRSGWGGVFFWVGFDGEGSKVPGSPDQ